MKTKILIITFLVISNFCFGQNLSKSEVVGKWKVIKVNIPNQVPQKEAVKLMTEAFTGAIFNFKGDGIFKIKFGKISDDRMKELFKLDEENWIVQENQIRIGADKAFSSMHITVRKANGVTYFILPMMQLEMKKIKNGKIKAFKKSKTFIELEKKKAQEPVELITVKIDEKDIIPFETVETPPLPSECISELEIETQKKCVNKFMRRHVARKFNAKLAANLRLNGTVKIDVEFIIDKTGKVVNITANGAPEILNQHAIEVIGRLPKLKPATQNKKPVNVFYQMPIRFTIVN